MRYPRNQLFWLFRNFCFIWWFFVVYTICDFSGFFDFFNFVFLVMCKAKISQLKNFFCLIKKFVRRYFHRFIYPTVKNWIFVIGIFFVTGIKIQYLTKIVNFCLKFFEIYHQKASSGDVGDKSGFVTTLS